MTRKLPLLLPPSALLAVAPPAARQPRAALLRRDLPAGRRHATGLRPDAQQRREERQAADVLVGDPARKPLRLAPRLRRLRPRSQARRRTRDQGLPLPLPHARMGRAGTAARCRSTPPGSAGPGAPSCAMRPIATGPAAPSGGKTPTSPTSRSASWEIWNEENIVTFATPTEPDAATRGCCGSPAGSCTAPTPARR